MIEDKLAGTVAFDIKWCGRHQSILAPDRQVVRQPAVGLDGTAGFLQQSQPLPLEERRGHILGDGVPGRLIDVLDPFDPLDF